MTRERKRVVIVDDDPSMLKSLGRLLRAHGFVTETYGSAEAFLERPSRSRPDVLILDIDLGGMSGIALRDRLKEMACQLPVIFITALDDADIHNVAVFCRPTCDAG